MKHIIINTPRPNRTSFALGFLANPWYWGGLLLGLPIAYPSIPYYVIGFAVFAIALLKSAQKLSISDLLLLSGLMVAFLLSNIANFNSVDSLRAFYTSVYFAFFLFGGLVSDRRAVLQGFVSMCGIMSAAVIVASLIQRPWDYGFAIMFIAPKTRLWGADIFPDWPNFFALMLSSGFLISALFFRSFWWSALIFIAALLTTSRIPILALGIFIAVSIISATRFRLRVWIIAALILSTLLAVSIRLDPDILSGLIGRLLILQDRAEIYRFGLDLIERNPLLGMGSVLFDESVGHTGHASYHNSYLDILVRHGLLGFIFFILLVRPPPQSQ